MNKQLFGRSVGVLVFSTLFVLRAAQAWHGEWLSGLAALQSGLAVWLYFIRRSPRKAGSLRVEAGAWASALLPLAFNGHADGWMLLLFIPGLLLMLWAMATLKDSFSIAPADRGIVRSGPYRLIRHPMYTGEILSFATLLFAAPSLRNLVIFSMLTASLLWRIEREEAIIRDYRTYQQETKWRLIWGVW